MMPVRLEHNHENSDDFGGRSSSPRHDKIKRRSQSEKRHGEKRFPGQRLMSKDKLRRTTSSVDSGAGVEDDESGSHAASEDIEESKNHNNNNYHHHDKNIYDSQTSGKMNQSLKRKVSSRRSKSNSNAGGDRASKQQTTTSDSAVSTSILSTSGLSTPTESRIFSSPNLSDNSKTSFSPKHSSNYPPLSRALRKKQERLKREMDLKETRFQIERQRFIEDTYRPQRSSSGKKRETSAPRGSRSLHRSYSNDSTKHSDKKMELDQRPASSKANERKGKTEKRSKSSDITNIDSRQTLISSKQKDNTASPREEEHDREKVTSTDNNTSGSRKIKIATTSQISVQTNSTFATNETPDSGGKEMENSTEENKVIDKKQKRKSRKDRSSSRRRRHESQERVDRLGLAEAENKVSTDSDDVFDKAVRKYEDTSWPTHDVDARMKQTMDSILRDGMPDIPSTEQITENGLLDWRAVFKVEMMRLRKEVNEFRMFCQNQVEFQARGLIKPETKERTSTPPDISNTKFEKSSGIPNQSPIVADQLRDLQANMKLFQKKQQLLDLETELLSQEERLSEKQNNLEEYEKEILEVESMLNHRQAICDRRQRTLVSLDEELQTLRTELEETREQMQIDGSIPESNSERAKKNWDMLKRNLMDEQKLLETTVQKYRSELASATSTIAGKDILISRLQSVVMQHEEEIGSRDKRIKQLESKLSIALSETRNLLDQLPSASQATFSTTNTSTKAESEFGSTSASQRLTNDPIPENQRVNSFRSSKAYYRRPSSNAASDQGDDYKHGMVNGSGGDDSGIPRNSFRASRKRNSISDNAISRLTLSTPRTEDKFGRTSSACAVQ